MIPCEKAGRGLRLRTLAFEAPVDIRDQILLLDEPETALKTKIMTTIDPRLLLFSVMLSAVLGSGCVSTGNKVEKGPNGTIAYLVEIESNEPGARVEANGDSVGKTPMTLKIFGDKDGTFHNFGSDQYVVQVFPVRTNQFIQTRTFRTGGWFSQEDRIPKRLYFDLNQKSEGFSIDLPKY